MITVDQVRGDMPLRFRDRFGPGGFRYLMDNGITYTNAHFEHIVTSTAAGHATLATGGNTPQHGIAGNDWFDTRLRRKVYNTEDIRHPVLGKPPGTAEGRSPRNLSSSTFGDELVIASAGKSRVFSVSKKDRGAILPGGHAGKAFWYSATTGEFVTSTYYYNEYPEWVQHWNAAGHADAFRGSSWELLLERGSYVFSEQDDRWFEKSYGKLGRVFPHPLENSDEGTFYAMLPHTPMIDQLTLNFVKALVSAENIGSNGFTDLLAVSFSAADYIGHAFGPNSLEMEDNLLRLDRTLAELFAFVESRVGLDKTLVVLSADHGTAPAPEYMAELGFKAGRVDTPEMMKRIDSILRAKFNTESNLVVAYQMPRIYLDPVVIESLGLDTADVERTVAEEAIKTAGISLALTRSDLMSGNLPDTQAARSASNGFHRERSGNILLIQEAFWYLSNDPDSDTATHGSPYNYDNHVPIMMAGPGIGHATINRRVAPRDIAPTISDYLGIAAPSGSIGTPLPRH